MKQQIKFVNADKTRFYTVLKQRVDNYFKENNISQHANGKMIFKTIFMFCLYFVPYAFILSNSIPEWAFWLCWAMMGLGLAGIGMSVMHDANHGAYSSSNKVNKILGLSLNLVGADANNWKTQHNVLHHTYTNIQDYDEDIDIKFGMRFSPNGKHNKMQKFQPLYVFFFYSLMTLYWVTFKDYAQYHRYLREGYNKANKTKQKKQLLHMLIWKIFYYSYILVIPILFLNMAWWKIILGFLLLHLIAGLLLSLVFQLAHVVENTSFPMPDDKGNIENEWAIHQLNTTADFSAKNPFITFFVGGLNYQIEHHLFQRVCHIHYPKIAPIVQQTAREFGIPYLYNRSFFSALTSHLRLLSKLGHKEAYQFPIG
jgi:linoleoyl-CoA desaturase